MTPDLDELVACGEELQRTCPGFMDGKVLVSIETLRTLSADLARSEADAASWKADAAGYHLTVQKQGAVIERLREAASTMMAAIEAIGYSTPTKKSKLGRAILGLQAALNAAEGK